MRTRASNASTWGRAATPRPGIALIEIVPVSSGSGSGSELIGTTRPASPAEVPMV